MSNKQHKRKGEKLLIGGNALADTSNQTKKVEEKSILGIASKNGVHVTVMIKSLEKKKIFKKLEESGKLKVRIPEIVHAVKLYYGLINCIETLPGVYICADGLNRGLVKHYLQMFLGSKYDNRKINIMRSLKKMFGKKNIAHMLALSVKRKNIKPSLELKEHHFKKLNLF